MESIQRITQAIRTIPDFPKKGIRFKDITPLLQDAQLFDQSIDLFAAKLKGKPIDYIAGIESRGFIFGAALAVKLGCGFVPIRKPGKLPYKTYSQSYELEYGTDSIEIHQDAFKPGDTVCLIDDLLATGGTAAAAVQLIRQCGATLDSILFLIELSFLNGREKLEGQKVEALISF
jgi:adenine phosphoribosyltransferase